MYKGCTIKPPFFEIGPKQYAYGEDILRLALLADAAAKKYDVDIIFTTPFCDIRMVKENTERIHVFAPHMDNIPVGRGLTNILPESIKAAGAEGVMLNHCERPLPTGELYNTIKRADELGLATIVCSDSIAEAKAIAQFNPNIIVCEPAELIGTGKIADDAYITESVKAVKGVNPDIYVLTAAGVSRGEHVYKNIYGGADATGTSSGLMKAPDWAAMVDEMIGAVRKAWGDRMAK